MCLWFAAALCFGCNSGDRGANQGVIERDSAGITIVENSAPQWQPARTWLLDPEPIVQIGMADGPPEQLLSHVFGAVRLSDGRIAVGTDNEIRMFDAAGKYLRTFGRQGAGPGEFTSASALYLLPGDSLLVFDINLLRMSVVHPDTGFMRSIPFAFFFDPVGVVDGNVIGWVMHHDERIDRSDAVFRDSTTLIRVRLDGTGSDTLGRFAGTEKMRVTRGNRTFTTPVPFGKQAVIATIADGFWFGAGDTYELGRYDAAARLVRIARRLGPREPLSEDAIAGYRAANPGSSDVARPTHFPPYLFAAGDAAGNIWIYSLTGSDAPAAWTVFDRDGRLLGDVANPEGGIGVPFQIGDDFFLTPHWDEDLVAYVRMYRLRKHR